MVEPKAELPESKDDPMGVSARPSMTIKEKIEAAFFEVRCGAKRLGL